MHKYFIIFLIIISTLHAKETLNVCVHGDWEPIEFKINKELKGISSDVFDIVKSKLDYNYNYIDLNADNIKHKKCDIVPAAIKVNSNVSQLNYTQPYYIGKTYIVKKKDRGIYKEDLSRYTLGCVEGSFLIKSMLFRDYPELKIVKFKSYQEMLSAINNDKIDLTLLDETTYNFHKDKYYTSNVDRGQEIRIPIEVSIGVVNDNIKLLSEISDIMADILIYNIDEIESKWIIKDEDKSIKPLLYFSLLVFILYLLYVIKNLYDKNTQLTSDNVLKSIDLRKTLELLGKHMNYSKTDINGMIVEVSEKFLEQTGYKKEELIGKTHSIIKSNNTRKEVFNEIWECLTKDKVYRGEMENNSKSGKPFWSKVVIYPEFDLNGNKVGYIGIREDITLRKKFESVIKEQEKMLSKQSKMADMGEMLEHISHQWRQPLSMISTSASGMLLKSELGHINKQELHDMCENITRNSEYLADTVDTFRNYLKGDSIIESNCISKIFKDISFLIEPIFREYKITLINNIPQNDEMCQVKVAKSDIEQIFMILLTNSKDVLVNRNIEVPYVIVYMHREDDKIILSVEDNGGGIHDDIKDKIFDPYFTTKDDKIGNGLGLHILNKIVSRMNGEIEVINVHEGVKFTIILPIEQ